MPHLVIHYSPNLESSANISSLCAQLAATILAQKTAEGAPLFPIGGTRVLAYPATHAAIADGKQDYAFVYLNLRIAKGRTPQAIQALGQALETACQAHFAPLLTTRLIGITLQIDEGQEVFDAKHSTLHPLFK